MKHLLIGLVRCYQLIIAPFLRAMNGGHGSCRHDPTCSHYAIEALRVHGVLRGDWLALCRLLKCHPWGTHGHDPVPPPRRRSPASLSSTKEKTSQTTNPKTNRK